MVVAKTPMNKIPKTCAGCHYFTSRHRNPLGAKCELINCLLVKPHKKRDAYCPLEMKIVDAGSKLYAYAINHSDKHGGGVVARGVVLACNKAEGAARVDELYRNTDWLSDIARKLQSGDCYVSVYDRKDDTEAFMPYAVQIYCN